MQEAPELLAVAWLWWHEWCMPHVRVAVKVVARCTPHPCGVLLCGVPRRQLRHHEWGVFSGYFILFS